MSTGEKVIKSDIKEIAKTWGWELWIVNDAEYCLKMLYVRKGEQCSYHYHPVKKETFHCTEGAVALTVEGKAYLLSPFARPKTILPGQKHSFYGITDAIILEVSTHHEDDDVVRCTHDNQ